MTRERKANKLYKPTKEDLQKATEKVVADVIKPNLTILFCGINPGLYTAATGHHFARPGNRFWKALYLSGLTPTLFHPSEQEKLLDLNIGITNLVHRASAQASEVSKEEFVQGGQKLAEKVKTIKPKWLVFVGIDAYRQAFDSKEVKVGPQKTKIEGTKVWLIPSTSGLNANYSLQEITELLVSLKREIEEDR